MSVQTRFIRIVGAEFVRENYESNGLCAGEERAHRGTLKLDIEGAPNDYEGLLKLAREHDYFDKERPDEWPTACDRCGRPFTAKAAHTSGPRFTFDTGEQPKPGDLYYKPCSRYGEGDSCYDWDDCTGRHLIAVCPDGTHWDVDGRAGNCARPEDRLHRCWSRRGEPENGEPLTVYHGLPWENGGGSIQTLYYHGMLQNGAFDVDYTPPSPPVFSWDSLAKRHDGKTRLLYRHERMLAEPFFEAAHDFLDVGGWGVLATRLIEEGKNCIILDTFTEDQYYADRVRSLPHKVGDVRIASCFDPKSFDVVCCFEVLEHVSFGPAIMPFAGLLGAINSISKWLRPNGWLVGTVPIPGTTHAVDDPTVEFIDEASLRWALGRHGFTDITIEPTVSVGLPGEPPCSLYFRAKKP